MLNILMVLVPNLKTFAYISSVSVFVQFIALTACFLTCLHGLLTTPGSFATSVQLTRQMDWSQVLVTSGVILYIIQRMTFYLPIKNSYPRVPKFHSFYKKCMNFVFGYIFLLALPFLLFFGVDGAEILFQNFGSEYRMLGFLKLMYVIVIFISNPINLFPIYKSVYALKFFEKMFVRQRGRGRKVRRRSEVGDRGTNGTGLGVNRGTGAEIEGDGGTRREIEECPAIDADKDLNTGEQTGQGETEVLEKAENIENEGLQKVEGNRANLSENIKETKIEDLQSEEEDDEHTSLLGLSSNAIRQNSQTNNRQLNDTSNQTKVQDIANNSLTSSKTDSANHNNHNSVPNHSNTDHLNSNPTNHPDLSQSFNNNPRLSISQSPTRTPQPQPQFIFATFATKLFVRLAITCVCIVMGICITSFVKFCSFVGAFFFSFLGLVLPGALLIAREPCPKSWLRRLYVYGVFGLGLVVFGASSLSSGLRLFNILD